MQGNTGAPDAWTIEIAAGHAASSKAHLSPPAVALQELIISSPMDCNTRYRRLSVRSRYLMYGHAGTTRQLFPTCDLPRMLQLMVTSRGCSCCDQTGHGPLTDQTAMSC